MLYERGQGPILSLTGHKEHGLKFEALEERAISFLVVMLPDIDDFFRTRDHFNGDVIVSSVLKDDQPPMNAFENELEGQISVRHGDN